jgi:diguanylate cyclase (GGDEF)-like protein
LCLLSQSCLALAAPPGTALKFDHLTSSDGLAQNTVTAIAQDPRGFMWIGTEDGLHQFDGYRFTVFRRGEGPHDLSGSLINSLLVDREGHVWVGTNVGGLDRYDPGTGRFRHFPAAGRGTAGPHELSNGTVWCLMQSRDGRIWIGTDGGLDVYDPRTDRFQHFHSGKGAGQGLRDDRIWALHEDARGIVWVGSYTGLTRYEPVRKTFRPISGRYKKHELLNNVSVNVIVAGPGGNTWVGAEGALLELAGDGTVVAAMGAKTLGHGNLAAARIRALLPDENGGLWIGTYGAGLLHLDPDTRRVERYQHDPADISSLGGNNIETLYRDSTGILWIGTGAGGISRLDPATRQFAHFRHQPGREDSLSGNIVWSMAEDQQGFVWIASGKGLDRLDRETGSFRHYRHDDHKPGSPPGSMADFVFVDRANRVWVGTDDGVGLLDRVTGKFKTYKIIHSADDLQANVVNVIFEDADGRLLIGTALGLYRLDSSSGKLSAVLPVKGLNSPMVLTLAQSPDGTLWVGTDAGLCRLDEKADRCVTPEAGAAGNYLANSIQTIRPGSGDTLWVGTANGLVLFDYSTGTAKRFTTKDGLPNDTVYGALQDGTGKWWFSTNRGLSQYDPAKGTFTNYDSRDGLQADEFNAGACYRAPDGELFFGGINGFNAFYPADIQRQSPPPRVAITRFLEFNHDVDLGKPVPALDKITLTWRQNVISFEFAAFNFAAPDRNRFSYQLQGFDDEWRDGGTRNRVTYTNLDPGTYVFRVKGTSDGTTWSSKPASMTVEVLPPPWLTWWAYLGYVLAGGALLLAVFQAQRRRMAREHALQDEQQQRRWAETLLELTHAMSSSLKGEEIAGELMSKLSRMVDYDWAALYMEQGIDIHMIAELGVNPEHERQLRLLPHTHEQLFAELRHYQQSRCLSGEELADRGRLDEGLADFRYLLVPLVSRGDEFSLLVLARRTTPFDASEIDTATAFARQAVVSLDNARLFSEVQNLATTDGLTGLHNRRYFFELGELEFNRSRRYDRNLALILLDVDKFKEINDEYGHDVGDRVLKNLANSCRTNLRHFDIIGRYGGDEFIIMLPETSAQVAMDVADRLRQSVEALTISTHRGPLRNTVSIGIAVVAEGVDDLAELVNRADAGLYEAKRGGRNRVALFDPDTSDGG